MSIPEVLQCPNTGLPLRDATLEEAEVALGQSHVRADAPFGKTQHVLLRSDQRAAYPIVAGIPILLTPEAITAEPQQIDLRDERWGEAYDEMQFYNASAETVGTSAIAALAERLLALSGTPADAPDWIDAPYDAAAQLDALQHLGDIRDKTVLQLGGKGVHAMKSLMAGAARAWLVTPMLSEVAWAQRLARELDVNDRFIGLVGIAEQIPLRDDLVDAIYMGGCLHHMTAEYAAPELQRVLSPGGRFAAVEPWQTPLHRYGTKLVGKREANAHCRPLTEERLAPVSSVFPDLQLRHHGPVLRYAALAAQKVTNRELRSSTGLRLARVDDRMPLPKRLGGSVAVLGGSP